MRAIYLVPALPAVAVLVGIALAALRGRAERACEPEDHGEDLRERARRLELAVKRMEEERGRK